MAESDGDTASSGGEEPRRELESFSGDAACSPSTGATSTFAGIEADLILDAMTAVAVWPLGLAEP